MEQAAGYQLFSCETKIRLQPANHCSVRLGLGFGRRGECLSPEECRSLLSDFARVCTEQALGFQPVELVCRAEGRDLQLGFEPESPCAAVCIPLSGTLEGWISWVVPWCPVDPPAPPSEGLVEQARAVARNFLDGALPPGSRVVLEQPFAAMDSAASIEGALAALMVSPISFAQLVARVTTDEGIWGHLHVQCPLRTLRDLRASVTEECA